MSHLVVLAAVRDDDSRAHLAELVHDVAAKETCSTENGRRDTGN